MMFACNVGIDFCFCWLIQMHEDQPRGADDTGGPSSCRDEDHLVPHDGGDAMRADDDATHDVVEGHSDAVVDDQSCEV
jgi:hypothetical protein